MLRFSTGVCCSRGAAPEEGGRRYNEDNYLLCHEGLIRYRQDNPDGTPGEARAQRAGHGLLAAVADGMGGHRFGALAAAAAVQALSRLYYREQPADPEAELHGFLLRAHRQVRARAQQGQLGDIGTTLTAAWVLGDRAYWAHVGDSRLYHLRGETLDLLTRDHTRAEFARRDGRPLPQQPDALVQSFLYGSRGLGHDADIRIDAGTDTGALRLEPGDRLLLCTDGLSRFLDGARLQALLAAADPAAAADALCDAALAAGSDDNLTAVVLVAS